MISEAKRRRKAFFLEFIPKSISAWREGYTRKSFLSDLIAGSSVGIISIPLAMAFAISSGLTPEKGLFTAIVAGFLISLLGGSRYQIGGPTGAFVIIVYGIIQRHGYDGLAVATLMASLILVLMGICRLGSLLRYIPYPVIVGFTAGIAVILFSTQIKDFFGLAIGTVPPEFVDKWSLYGKSFSTLQVSALAIGLFTVLLNVSIKRMWPKGPVIIFAIIGATGLAFLLQLPVETIAKRFGSIPRGLPHPSLPMISIEKMRILFPDALSIAFLGGIESLLSCAIADGLTGKRHRSNCELVGQGIANFGSIIFGGIPATGAIARTTANVQLGAISPLSGIVHAITILLLMLLCAPLVNMIPLACLAAVLIVVAWNMSEHRHFMEILKGPRDEAAVLLLTFLLTILADMTIAIVGGVILAALLFIRRMSHSVKIEPAKVNPEKSLTPISLENLLQKQQIPDGVMLFEVKGPLFFGVTDLLEETLKKCPQKPKVLILLLNLPLVDLTAERALKLFWKRCHQESILLLVSGVPDTTALRLESESLPKQARSYFINLDLALAAARSHVTAHS